VSEPKRLETGATARHAGRSSELLVRILSAAVMALVAVGAVLAGSWPFALLVALGAAIVNWEWARLIRGNGLDHAARFQALGLLAVIYFAVTGRFGTACVMAAVVLLGLLILRARTPDWAWSAGGVLYMALPAISLVWLRSDATYGATALLFLLVVAWTADTAAFAGGRLIGGPKLAPAVSPKKTWAGLLAGSLVPMLVGYGCAVLVLHRPGVPLMLVALLLAFACQLGDLLESAIKRCFGAKDASGLIPGHGGLLDRIDGLMLASPIAALIALRDLAHPGRGLLLW
jgi:phosphatidate cytidylyltransferase